MCPYHHSESTKPSVFTTHLETTEAPATFFRLIGYLDGVQIAKAHGDFHDNGVFRLINIDVYDKSSRNKGFATVMIHRLMEEADKRDCNEFVFIGVADDNAKAARLYTRLGAFPREIPQCSTRHDYVCPLPNDEFSIET